MIRILTYSTPDEVATFVASQVISSIHSFTPSEQKPFLVLGLPTGSTPIPVYQKLIAAYQKKEISFKNVVTFNMDEYKGLSAHHPKSYHFFMNKYLFNHIDLPHSHIHILDGMTPNPQKACVEYENQIKAFGGIDIQLGGIGENGHLAFNEPGSSFESVTHVQQLTENTIQANARFFEKTSDVPTEALTIGLKTIFEAQKVIILATGIKKAFAVHQTVFGPISVDCPSSILQTHSNATLVCDTAAFSI